MLGDLGGRYHARAYLVHGIFRIKPGLIHATLRDNACADRARTILSYGRMQSNTMDGKVVQSMLLRCTDMLHGIIDPQVGTVRSLC